MQTNDLSFEELEKNAVNAGLCSYQQYCENPEKWRNRLLGHENENLEMLDNGSQLLGNSINKIEYRFRNYKIKTTEELDRVLRDCGVSPRDLVPKPQFRNCVSGKGDLIVYLVDKNDSRLRG